MRFSHHGFPDIIDADIRSDIHGDACLLHRVEISAERGPRNRLAIDRRSVGGQFAFERPRGLAFAKNFCRHALTDFALSVAIFQQNIIGMRVHIDESGCDDQSLGVNFPMGRTWRYQTNRHDSIAANRDITAKPGVASAVYNGCIADQQIVSRFCRRCMGSECDQGRKQGQESTAIEHVIISFRFADRIKVWARNA